MGGGNHLVPPLIRVIGGLSPRGRGKHARTAYGKIQTRSIPAWAGETYLSEANALAVEVYPRVGGGNIRQSLDVETGAGLSPRGRGKPNAYASNCAGRRSIPAWAGETMRLCIAAIACRVYPRVGGGNYKSPADAPKSLGLSPRGRGKPPLHPVGSRPGGSIPAWAGETRRERKAKGDARVYPRVGGGNVDGLPPVCSHEGLSPRGRGKP